MSVSLEKIQGVESVKVSLNEGKASIQLKPGNTVSVDHVHQVVKKHGFNPQHANVTARAEVVIADGKPQLKIAGPDVTYDVGDPDDRTVQEGLKKEGGKTVTVAGVVPAPKDGTSPRLIQVKSFQPAPSLPE